MMKIREFITVLRPIKEWEYFYGIRRQSAGGPANRGNTINFVPLSLNPNAIDLLEENPDKINWDKLSSNPNATNILWKNLDKINYTCLSANPSGICILEKFPDKINWSVLSKNPHAIHLLKKNLDKVDWMKLSENPNAIHLLKDNLDKVDWMKLSENPNAIEILEENFDKINWNYLCKNPKAIGLIKKNPEKINWRYLGSNPNAVNLINQKISEQGIENILVSTQDINQICWYDLIINTNPLVIKLVKDNYETILSKLKFNSIDSFWHIICRNESAITLIEKNSQYISWDCISLNPGIFEYDYEGMKQKMVKSDFFQELMENRFHPSNSHKWRGWGFEDMVLEENESDGRQIKRNKVN